MIDDIISVNIKCFGRGDPYSKKTAYNEGVLCMESKANGETVAYLLYRILPDYISIERIGTLKEKRGKGLAKVLLSRLKRLAGKKKKPIRTYVRYDNLPSYLMHIKSGFHPTHVAWNVWVWVEYTPKTLEV